MKNKILLLSNTMLFHFSFCSLYKHKFDIHPLLLRYLNKNLKHQSEHFYIQIQEQKRKKLLKSRSFTEPNRLILTNKQIQSILDKSSIHKFDSIVIEIQSGTKEELLLLKKLNSLDIPITVFVSSANSRFIDEINDLNITSLLHFTDLFNFKLSI